MGVKGLHLDWTLFSIIFHLYYPCTSLDACLLVVYRCKELLFLFWFFSYTFSCAFSLIDDMLIKLWDWDKKWQCSQVFEGHTHYVMQIVINPKDNNQFASASLDRTIKVGVLNAAQNVLRWFQTPNFFTKIEDIAASCCLCERVILT